MSFQWRPYVPVAQRRANAAKKMAKMAKSGEKISPVKIEGRTIAKTFWGKAWCDNLESYSDYSNRLPRGRTYVRNGSVVNLQIAKGKVSACVSGSELYKIEIAIKPLDAARWKNIQKACSGKIDSLIELLQGKLSSGVMEIVTHRDSGLFPKPAEISLDCSCPDWADMCKHVAASLYGVGARLDEQPELLFLMRGVDPSELISKTSAEEVIKQTAGQPSIAEGDLAEVFGIELDAAAPQPKAAPAKKQKRPARRAVSAKKAIKKPVKPALKKKRKQEI